MTVVFDLDDTLFPEIDFVRSAYRLLAIGQTELLSRMMTAANPAGAFDIAASATGLDIAEVINIYRTHLPDISLPEETEMTLSTLRDGGVTLGLITDGRTITQSNKIRALGLNRFIAPELIFISESVGADKTSQQSFLETERIAANPPYFYVGDNPAKDFIQPNSLGWTSVMLFGRDNNIHTQDCSQLADNFRPSLILNRISELPELLNLKTS